MNDIVLFFGFAAAILSILQHIPQIQLIYDKKQVDEISLLMIFLRLLTAICSSIYIGGIINEIDTNFSLPMVISNVGTYIVSLILLYFKTILYNNNYEKRKDIIF